MMMMMMMAKKNLTMATKVGSFEFENIIKKINFQHKKFQIQFHFFIHSLLLRFLILFFFVPFVFHLTIIIIIGIRFECKKKIASWEMFLYSQMTRYCCPMFFFWYPHWLTIDYVYILSGFEFSFFQYQKKKNCSSFFSEQAKKKNPNPKVNEKFNWIINVLKIGKSKKKKRFLLSWEHFDWFVFWPFFPLAVSRGMHLFSLKKMYITLDLRFLMVKISQKIKFRLSNPSISTLIENNIETCLRF